MSNTTQPAWRRILPDVLCVALFAVIAFAYFSPAALDGRRLTGHDNSGADGLSVEINNYISDNGGEIPRWINSIFCGMPTYQIAPSYDSTATLSFLGKAYHLWFPDYVWYVFASMLGFYILLRAFDFRHWMAALGAVVWAFSSYFFIIIMAGHIWKVITLCYIPPTIAGIVLCYRGRLLWGGILTAFFAALQISANHVQMTYYFLIPEICIFLAYLVEAVRDKKLVAFAKATGAIAAAAVIAVGINASNLYHTYEYSKETMRGKSELTKAVNPENQTSDGLERDYITQWSYGIGETWSLLVPNVRGGASDHVLSESETAMAHANPAVSGLDAQVREAYGISVYSMFPQYWGTQPGTSGPVYVGALVFMLFLFAMLALPDRSALKWGLFVATVLSILLSWGHNFMPFTDFFIDYVPMYSKFRTVSSILVVAEFTIPMLALLGLKYFFDHATDPAQQSRLRFALFGATGVTLLICLFFALAPTAGGDCLNLDRDRQTIANYLQGIDEYTASALLVSLGDMRAAMLSADAWRSAGIIAIGALVLIWYAFSAAKHKEGPSKTVTALTASVIIIVCLGDMWAVNKRYLYDSLFETPRTSLAPDPSDTDNFIQSVSGNGRNYRVLNLTVSPFNDNTTSYRYSSVGGYHAAKLRRYQELVEEHLLKRESNDKEINRLSAVVSSAQLDTVAMIAANDVAHPRFLIPEAVADSAYPVLNMLNTRWFILGGAEQPVPVENTAALGNAWFVDKLTYVDDANAELAALHTMNPRHAAVADKCFADILGDASVPATSAGDTIIQTALSSTSVSYEATSRNGGLAVFSEVYYPGWNVTVDGQSVEVGRVNYILRALRLPAGKHTIVMTFDPQSVHTTELIAYISYAILALAVIAAIVLKVMKAKRTKEAE